jgi:hypothetical protein
MCNNTIGINRDDCVKKQMKALNDVVREYNGVAARFAKDKSKENEALLNDVLLRLKQAANEVIID